MTLSHLRVHRRYANSDSSILADLVAPVFSAGVNCQVPFTMFKDFIVCILINPQPVIVPRVISSHFSASCGHRSFATSQMIFLALCEHSIKMWLIDSVSPQAGHLLLSLKFFIFSQYRPIFWVPWISLYRNSCTLSRIGWRLVLSQIVSSVSKSPEWRCRNSLVFSRFILVVCLIFFLDCSLNPLYARACVI